MSAHCQTCSQEQALNKAIALLTNSIHLLVHHTENIDAIEAAIADLEAANQELKSYVHSSRH